jgi:hypothetical protein
MSLQDPRLLVLAILFGLTGIVACNDTGQPTFPQAQLGLTDPTQIAEFPETIDDEFARIARDQIPGFAGHYLDEHSNSVVYLVDPGGRAAAESYVAEVRSSLGLADGPVTIRPAKYDFLQLREWRDQLLSVLTIDGVVLLDIDETANRIWIGVEDQESIRRVEEMIAAQQVPEDAILVEIHARPVRALNIRDHERPVKSGFQIENESFDTSGCSLGFNAVQSGQRVFVTASHCTEICDGLDYSVEAQDERQEGKAIGYEVNDKEPYTCWPGPPCRYADAATFTYYDSVADVKGYITRTMGPPPQHPGGSRDVDPSKPNFPIKYKVMGVLPVGTWINKLGYVNGWTRGPISRSCISMHVELPDGWYKCQNEVYAGGTHGDSGGPVFIAGGTTSTWNESLSDASLAGILVAALPDHEYFYYSQMQYIEAELGYFNVWAPSPPPPMTVWINGPDSLPAYQQVTVQAIVSHGTPPFTYEWQVDGSPKCGNQDWCSAIMGPPYSQTYFYVTVTDVYQNQASKSKLVKATYPW